MAKDLSTLFNPKSIAVVGASRYSQKVGGVVLQNIIDSKFPGKIYPVNPQAQSINGLNCSPNIDSLPETPDLAVIALPAGLVLETITQIGEKGIKNVVVYSAGFKEAGEEGIKLEQELVSRAKKYQLNLLGPNCLGFVNNLCPVNATFGQALSQSGNLRFISQSGAIATSLFDWCASIGLNFSEFITLGNKALVTETDVLSYLQNRSYYNSRINGLEGLSSVNPIGLYLESISNGEEFIRLCSQISKTDPVFILKPGKTVAAAKAMQSHTGAIAGEDLVLEAALMEAGVIRSSTLEDFFDLSKAFAWGNVPSGPRIAIVSNAGGPAVISADAVIEAGLQLAELDSSTCQQLAQILPRSASIINPVDLLGDALAERFSQACEIVLKTSQVDALLVILTPQIMTQIEKTAQFIGNLSKKYQKPILCSFIGGTLVAQGESKLNEYKIPSFRFPERAIFALGQMWRFRKHQQILQKEETVQVIKTMEPLIEIKELVENAVQNNRDSFDNVEADEVVSSAGIPTPPTIVATDLSRAEEFAQRVGWPVVLKLSATGLLHKREVGGVVTDIRDKDQLENAWETLQRKINHLQTEDRRQIKIQIQKDVASGVEVIVGVKHDPTFGPVLLFGAGGTLTELIGDYNLHLLPIGIPEAKELVEKSKIYSVLRGGIYEPPYALDKLYEVIVSLGKLAENLPQIKEIEINPLIMTLNDVWAVDTKIVLNRGENKVVAAPKFQVATTTAHTLPATTYHYYTFETEKPLVFQPGEYINVKVAENRLNCYSIAGQLTSNQFNLFVDTLLGGPGSKFFQNLKVGDKITYLGPFGVFNLKLNDGARHLLFLGTGCGFAPLKCMIEAALKEYNCKLPMTLYLGLKTSQDLFREDYFQKMSQIFPNFKYKIIIDKSDKSWRGDSGFITEFLSKDFPDASSCAAYLCGNKAMITEATNILLARGCPKERIYTEKL